MVHFITHLTISWEFIPTHPHNEGAINGICGFIGTEGFDDGLIVEREGFFDGRVGANVGRGDRMKGGSLEYSTGKLMRNAPTAQNLGP
jgi:hypothetical protein